MATNSALAHSWDGINQGVFLMPSGTTPPTSPAPTPWPTAAKDVGWINDNGVTETRANQETKKYGFQGNGLVKVLRSQYEYTFKFVALEKNRVTDGVVNPGSTIVTAAAVNTISDFVPSGQIIQAIGADFQNGAINERWIIPIAEINSTADMVYVGNDLTGYEFTVTCYANSAGLWRFRVNNDLAFVAP